MRWHIWSGTRWTGRSCAAVVALALAAVLAPGAAAGQEPSGRTEIMAAWGGTGASELRRYDELVDALVRTDDLALAGRQPDHYLSERVHEGLMQYHEGVPVVGGGVSRQLDGGVTVSLFGTIHEGIDVDTTPTLTAAEALARMERRSGAGPVTNDPPTLVILPTLFDTYVLAWRAAMRDLRVYFVDAHSGAIVHSRSLVHYQTALGVGTGTRGQQKKLSTSPSDGGFEAYDRLRPGAIVTLDVRNNIERLFELLGNPFELTPGAMWRPSDVARDADNEWEDAGVVDAHAHAGFVYDFLARHGWNGMDGRNGPILTMVNLGEIVGANALFASPPLGPGGAGAVAFGHDGDGSMAVLDVVGHEIMHGVTFHSVRNRTGAKEGFGGKTTDVQGPSRATFPSGRTAECGRRYRYGDDDAPFYELRGLAYRYACRDGRLLLFANDGGAINEAYSDILGTAVEFFEHDPPDGPLEADYLLGEDTLGGSGFIRALDHPDSLTVDGPPDGTPYPIAYRGLIRFLVEVFEEVPEWAISNRFFSSFASTDGGRTFIEFPPYIYDYDGIHWNASVLSHAYFLAIEGGNNAVTGRTVQGVGAANRQDVERVFLRSMIDMMPSLADMPMAANVIRQSAVDLFGAGSPTWRAIDDALRAVDLPPR